MKNNWDVLNTDCKNYIIEWKNKLNYFHTGFYYFNDLIFGKIYIFIVEVTMSHVIILDLNIFKTEPLLPKTFPYLTTLNLIFLLPLILFAEINNLSEQSLVAP